MNVDYKPQVVNVSVRSPTLGIEVGTPIAREYVEREPYVGEYTVTPSQEEQTLSTKNLRMTDDVKINPIPSNYGRIDWNGQYLTVS